MIENYLNCCLTLLMKEKKTLMKENFEHFAFAFLHMFKDGVLHGNEFYHSVCLQHFQIVNGAVFPARM